MRNLKWTIYHPPFSYDLELPSRVLCRISHENAVMRDSGTKIITLLERRSDLSSTTSTSYEYAETLLVVCQNCLFEKSAPSIYYLVIVSKLRPSHPILSEVHIDYRYTRVLDILHRMHRTRSLKLKLIPRISSQEFHGSILD